MKTATRCRIAVYRSPLAEAANTFDLLTCPPFPLGLPGATFAPTLGVPSRFLSLRQLARLLRRDQCNQALRFAVWHALVARAAGGDPAWRVAALHMAARRIRRQAKLLAASAHIHSWAAQAEVIVGLLRAIETGTAVDIDWLA